MNMKWRFQRENHLWMSFHYHMWVHLKTFLGCLGQNRKAGSIRNWNAVKEWNIGWGQNQHRCWYQNSLDLWMFTIHTHCIFLRNMTRALFQNGDRAGAVYVLALKDLKAPPTTLVKCIWNSLQCKKKKHHTRIAENTILGLGLKCRVRKLNVGKIITSALKDVANGWQRLDRCFVWIFFTEEWWWNRKTYWQLFLYVHVCGE